MKQYLHSEEKIQVITLEILGVYSILLLRLILIISYDNFSLFIPG